MIKKIVTSFFIMKVMRGGSRIVRRARHFLNFKHIINNFVDPHLELQGKTPAEAASFVKITVSDENELNLNLR